MTTRNTDINLVIRAKTEGEKAITSLAAAVDHLISGAGSGSQQFSEFGRNVAALDKAAAGLAAAQDKVGTSASKQASAIHDATAGITEQQQRVETLARGVSILGKEADKAFVGPRRDGLADMLRLAKSELTDAQRQLDRYTGAFDRNLAALQTSRSGLLDLRRSTAETAEAQASAAAAVELTTQALARQTEEARRAAAAQSFYNSKGAPGLANGPASANGATTDALVQHFQRLEVEASKVRQAIDPVSVAVEKYEARIKDVRAAALNGIIGSDDAIIRERQLRFELTQTIEKIAEGAARIREDRRNAVTEYQALINDVTGVTGKRATESGATYEALDADQRAREARVRAREAEQIRDAANAAGGVGRAAATDPANGTNRATFSALEERAAEQEAAAVREAAQAYQLFEARARQGAQALKEAEAAAEQDAATMQRLRDKIDPAAAIQRKLNVELSELRRLAGPAGLSTEELARAERHLRDEANEAAAALKRRGGAASGEGFKATAFGLKPYELQNLSYQINDVITGLASGQKLSQVVAQQGGQILQLFPKVGGAIFAALSNPVFLTAASTIGLIVLGLKNASDQAERLRNATADLGRRSNGGDYQAAGVVDQQRDLQRLGATAEQARAALNTFIDMGVPQQSLGQFGRIAKETADILGTDLPEAAKQVTTAFTGGYQAIAELDNRLNFLTSAQREHIRQLFEEGHAQEAQTLALNIYTSKMDAAAASARGPWTEANRALRSSWTDLLDSFGKTTVIQAASEAVNTLAEGVERLAKALDGTDGDQLALGAARFNQRALTQLLDPTYRQQQGLPELTDQVRAQIQAELDQAKAEIARLEAKAKQTASGQSGAPTTTGDTPQARERADRIAALTDEEKLQKLRDDGQTRILTAAEQTSRIQLAGAVAFRQEQDAAVGAIRRQTAGAHEQAAIQRETKAAQDRARADAQRAQQEREQTIRRYLQRIGAAEGGAGPNGAGSSALGIGQFTRGTFVGTYRQANPGTRYNDDQIAGLRRDPTTAAQILDIFTRQNAQFLTRLHETISGANLYLIHFLGQGTGRAVLKAGGNERVDGIIRRVDPNAEDVLAKNRSYLYNRDGTAKTRNQLLSFLGNRVGDAAGIGGEDNGSSAAALQKSEAEREEQDRRRQADFDLSVQQANEDRRRTIDNTRAQAGLHGGDLLDLQRTQAQDAAVQDLRQHIEEINRALPEGHALITVTDQQIADVRGLAGALVDVQQAKDRIAARRDDVQRPIDELQEQKQLLQQQAEFLRSIGDNDGADRVDEQIRAMSGSIGEAIDKAIEFYQALDQAQRVSLGILDEGQFQLILERLRQLKDSTQEWGKIAGVSAQDVARAFATAAVNAFTNFINKVAAGKNVFKSLVDGIREFASAFISSVAQMILQLLAYAAAVTILRALGVPVPATSPLGGGTSVGVGSSHTGGIAGHGTGQRRQVDPRIFAGMMRYHTGGIAGLAPDEVGIVARKGEEILTEENPRHRNNIHPQGEAQSRSANVNIYTLFNEADLAERILRTPAGEKAFINMVSENRAAFKAAMG